MALQLASRFIRVNAIHPTNCNTHLVHNEGLYTLFRPDLAGAGQPVSREDAELAFTAFQRSEEHTSELQSLMRISYAVFCLKKKKKQYYTHSTQTKLKLYYTMTRDTCKNHLRN